MQNGDHLRQAIIICVNTGDPDLLFLDQDVEQLLQLSIDVLEQFRCVKFLIRAKLRSPQQFAGWLRAQYPDELSMNLSRETNLRNLVMAWIDHVNLSWAQEAILFFWPFAMLHRLS